MNVPGRLVWVLMIMQMSILAHCQDMHFSQYMRTGVWLSPAETGMGEGQYRFTAGHRNQWASVSQAFVSYHFSFDTYFSLGEKGQRLGLGLLFLRDEAGDVGFGTTAGELNVALAIPIPKTSHYFSAGIKAGFNQRSIDLQMLRFDDSFNGSIYDPNYKSNDQVDRASFAFLDLAAGMSWENRKDQLQFWKAGISFFHLNRPGQSFYVQDSILLDIRSTLFVQHGFLLDRYWYLRPEALISIQGPYREYLLGAWVGHILEKSPFGLTTMEAGLFTRAGDALLLGIAGQRNTWKAAITYDVNYSGLRPASHLRGGWEISLGYTISRNPPKLTRVPACFML